VLEGAALMANTITTVSTTIPLRVQELIGQHGGLRPAARVLGMTPQYLLRLQNGEKDNPSPAILKKLGLKRFVSYVRVR
jgi:hypothetical protein